MGRIYRGGGGSATSLFGITDHQFDDAAARDAFYAVAGNRATLRKGRTEILLLDDGSGDVDLQLWVGADNPPTYDNTMWHGFSGAPTSPSVIKTLYESNPETNALVDAKLAILNLMNLTADGDIEFDVSGIFPPDSVFVSENLGIEGSGEAFGVLDRSNDRRGYLVAYERAAGTRPFYRRLGPLLTGVSIQPLKDTDSGTQTFIQDVTFTANRLITKITIESSDDVTGASIIVKRGGFVIASMFNLSFTKDVEKDIDISQGLICSSGAPISLEVSGVTLKGTGTGVDFEIFLELDNYEYALDELSSAATVVADIEAKTGADRLDATKLRNLPVARTDEDIRDVIGTALRAGVGISIVVDDDNDTITISNTGSGPTFNQPRITNFITSLADRVDLNTDLNIQVSLTFDVMHQVNINGDLTLEVTTGDNKTVAAPFVDGQNTKQVTLSGIDTSSPGTVTFKLTGVDTRGGTFESNIVSVEVRTLAEHEFIYYGQSTTNVPANIALGSLDTVVAQTGTFTAAIGPLVANNYVVFLYPQDHQITAITNTDSGTNEFSAYPVAGTRTIGTVTYDVRALDHTIDPLAAGLTFNYRVEVS